MGWGIVVSIVVVCVVLLGFCFCIFCASASRPLSQQRFPAAFFGRDSASSVPHSSHRSNSSRKSKGDRSTPQSHTGPATIRSIPARSPSKVGQLGHASVPVGPSSPLADTPRHPRTPPRSPPRPPSPVSPNSPSQLELAAYSATPETHLSGISVLSNISSSSQLSDTWWKRDLRSPSSPRGPHSPTPGTPVTPGTLHDTPMRPPTLHRCNSSELVRSPRRLERHHSFSTPLSADPLGYRQLDVVLAHKEGSHMLLEFLVSIFAAENLLFFYAVEKLLSEPTPELAQEIFHEFIRNGARSMVNIAGPRQKELVVACQKIRSDAALDQAVLDVFEKAQHDVHALLETDLFPRFLKSPPGLEWQSKYVSQVTRTPTSPWTPLARIGSTLKRISRSKNGSGGLVD